MPLIQKLSAIFFLDEWNNLLERINCKTESEVFESEDTILQLRHWVSLRGQTLSRTGTLKIVLSMKLLHFFSLLLMDTVLQLEE